MSRARLVVALSFALAVPVAACAKKREEPKPAAVATVKPASSVQCTFESVTASAKLEIDVLSLELPASEVRRVLECSHAAYAECAGTLGDGQPPVLSTEVAAVVTVDQRGFVTDVKTRPAKGAPPPAPLPPCLEAILRRTSFPAGEKNNAEVRLGFTFDARPFEELEKLPRFAGAQTKLESFEVASGAVSGLPAASDAVIRRARGCYLLALQGADATKGTIAFTVALSDKGIDDVKTTPDGTMGKELVSCVDTVLRNTTFERPKAKAVVRGKLSFDRAAPAPAAVP